MINKNSDKLPKNQLPFIGKFGELFAIAGLALTINVTPSSSYFEYSKNNNITKKNKA